MLKRKRAAEEGASAAAASSAASSSSAAAAAKPAASKSSASAAAPASKLQRKEEARDVSRYINKQRTLVLSSRGITHRDRHLLSDLRDLLPHSKKDVKFDAKDDLATINELCEMKNCQNTRTTHSAGLTALSRPAHGAHRALLLFLSVALLGNNCIFFEARKRKDLYMWVSKAPSGPSAKFQVQNIHTMAEVKLTGQTPLNSARECAHRAAALRNCFFHLHSLLFVAVIAQVTASRDPDLCSVSTRLSIRRPRTLC